MLKNSSEFWEVFQEGYYFTSNVNSFFRREGKENVAWIKRVLNNYSE
jgi:hypothetical protein